MRFLCCTSLLTILITMATAGRADDNLKDLE